MKNSQSGLLTGHLDKQAVFEPRPISVRRSFVKRAMRSAGFSKMLDTIRKIWMPSHRRRHILDEFRRNAADCGYALDDLTDAELESAITRGKYGIEKLPPLTGKTLYWALRRISPDARQLARRKLK